MTYFMDTNITLGDRIKLKLFQRINRSSFRLGRSWGYGSVIKPASRNGSDYPCAKRAGTARTTNKRLTISMAFHPERHMRAQILR